MEDLFYIRENGAYYEIGFPSRRDDKEFQTLDGKQIIQCRSYAKMIGPLNIEGQLSKEEQLFLIERLLYEVRRNKKTRENILNLLK